MEIVPNASQLCHNARRRVLYSVVCATCHESGFGTADRLALDVLLQMLNAVITEIGRSGRAFSELSGRTEPLIGDVIMALIEMGISVESISSYGLRANRVIIASPQQMTKQNPPRILQAGEKKALSPYIPEYFPPFPDPHSYIRTPTHKQPVTEYEAIREKSATQKRDVERALTRYMAKTCDTSLSHSLFPDEQMCHLFPLIALKVCPNSYLNALLPKDQVFDDDDNEQLIQRKEPEKKTKTVIIETPVEPQASTSTANLHSLDDIQTPDSHKSMPTAANPMTSPITSTTDNDVLDNPYLRPVKLSKKSNRKQNYFDIQ